jgi:hypothetical protein
MTGTSEPLDDAGRLEGGSLAVAEAIALSVGDSAFELVGDSAGVPVKVSSAL